MTMQEIPDRLRPTHDALVGSIRKRSVRRARGRRTLAVVALILTAGSAVAIADGGFPSIPTDAHQQYVVETTGSLRPIDGCTEQGGVLQVCVGAIGTSFMTRAPGGKWVAPSGCTFSSDQKTEECTEPVHVRIDLSDPQHPQLIAVEPS
jgi:hypothetical protein